ncbi:MAG: prenyltransferase/squalene oxidase repeat-containing protein [Planctomycetota bacterium]
MRRLAIATLILSVLLGRSIAQDDPQTFNKKRLAAIDKGVEWLKKQQAADGSFSFDKDKPLGVGIQMKPGCTSLCALALLKSGVGPGDPVIEKAFEYLCGLKGPDYVYSAGCILLAIEARHHWDPPSQALDPDDFSTKEKGKGGPRKPANISPRELELAEICKEYLVKQQTPNGSWTYPLSTPKGDEKADASHPQYALLGLDAAERLGLVVPRESYLRAINYFVENQEKDGPEVAPFPVFGADCSFKELAKIEKEVREKIQKIEGQFSGKKPTERNSAGRTEADERRTVEREAHGKMLKTVAKPRPMFARGWCYAYKPAENGSWKKIVNGSMTASALTSLCVCKAHLDQGGDYEKLRAPVDKALRDGAAWLAHNYSVANNPAGDKKTKCINHYYYMYGLERAGILGLVPQFGEHDWFIDGCKMFIDAQKADGDWDAGASGTAGPIPDTCFALLFLCRGTTPFVKIPTRTATGTGGK